MSRDSDTHTQTTNDKKREKQQVQPIKGSKEVQVTKQGDRWSKTTTWVGNSKNKTIKIKGQDFKGKPRRIPENKKRLGKLKNKQN